MPPCRLRGAPTSPARAARRDEAAALIGDALALLEVDELASRRDDAGGGPLGRPRQRRRPARHPPGPGAARHAADADRGRRQEVRLSARGGGRASGWPRGSRWPARAARSWPRSGAPAARRSAVVLAKAVGPLAVVVELAAPLLAPGGLLAGQQDGGGGAARGGRGRGRGRRLRPRPRPHASPLRARLCPARSACVFEKVAATPAALSAAAGHGGQAAARLSHARVVATSSRSPWRRRGAVA